MSHDVGGRSHKYYKQDEGIAMSNMTGTMDGKKNSKYDVHIATNSVEPAKHKRGKSQESEGNRDSMFPIQGIRKTQTGEYGFFMIAFVALHTLLQSQTRKRILIYHLHSQHFCHLMIFFFVSGGVYKIASGLQLPHG